MPDENLPSINVQDCQTGGAGNVLEDPFRRIISTLILAQHEVAVNLCRVFGDPVLWLDVELRSCCSSRSGLLPRVQTIIFGM